MSKKVKFGDVVAAAKAEESDSEVSEEEEVAPKFEVRLNPLSVMDRLKVFVSKSLDERADTRSEDDESAEEYEDVSDVEGEEYEESDGDDEEEGVEEDLVGDDVAERDIRDEDLDSSDELETRRDTSTADYYFDAQFNGENSGDHSAAKMRLLSKIEGTSFDLYGNVNFDAEDDEAEDKSPLPVAPGPYSTIAQMPGLHKLFRGEAACERIDPRAVDEVNGHVLPYLAAYADAFVEGRETSNDDSLLNGLLLHTVSHTVKARAKVIKHNQKLQRKLRDSIVATALAKETTTAKAAKKNKAGKGAAALPIAIPDESVDAITTEDADAMRDQGFCRPRVLILCPFRGTALRVVQQIRSILGENTSVSGWDKLQDEFSQLEEEDETGPDSKKPQDWKDLFSNQNIDDDFKVSYLLSFHHIVSNLLMFCNLNMRCVIRWVFS